MDIESAVNEAVEWAIHNGVLSEYLSLHKSEVVGMILTEYDEKKVMENLKKESYEEGRAEGREEGRKEGRFDTLASLVKDGILSLSDAAKRADLSTDEFRLKAGLL